MTKVLCAVAKKLYIFDALSVFKVQSCKSAFPDVAKESPLLQPGGAYKPRKKPRQKVAIIIPFK